MRLKICEMKNNKRLFFKKKENGLFTVFKGVTNLMIAIKTI